MSGTGWTWSQSGVQAVLKYNGKAMFGSVGGFVPGRTAAMLADWVARLPPEQDIISREICSELIVLLEGIIATNAEWTGLAERITAVLNSCGVKP